MLDRASLLALLEKTGVSFTLHEHPACFTAEEARTLCAHIPGAHCKNLFLKDKAGALFLLTVPDGRPVDLKAVQAQLGCQRLSFGSAALLFDVLGVTPGSVTPLAVLNDAACRVRLFVDASLMAQPILNVHPLENTATISLAPDDMARLLAAHGHAPERLMLA